MYVGFMHIDLHQAPHLAMQVWEWKSSIFHFQLNFEGFAILTATFACAGPVGAKQFVSHICVAQGRVFLLESKALQNPPVSVSRAEGMIKENTPPKPSTFVKTGGRVGQLHSSFFCKY